LEEETMHRRQVLLAVMGLALMAGIAQADVPKTLKLFGRDYDVIATKRTGAFKNGVTVNPQMPDSDNPVVPLKANLAFAQGDNTNTDRLFVVAATQAPAVAPTGNLDTPTSDGFYLLQGTDANGVFSPENSDAHVFFRGNLEVHGRMQAIAYINDTDTGVKKDHNLAAFTFTDANYVRWYDLGDLLALPDTGTTALDVFRTSSVLGIIQNGITEEPAGSDPPRNTDLDDPNMSTAGWLGLATAPNGALITIGPANGDWEIAVIDAANPKAFYPIKTALANTAAVDKVDVTQTVHTLAHLKGDEYLALASTGDPNWDESQITAGTLYHLRITLPTDLTKEAPDSIKVDVLDDPVDIVATGLGQGESKHIFGLTVGRELNGANILYMADYAGNLFTLRPTAATAGQ
jgi:hypothetical protein